jgi:hypothetical protein
VSDGQQIGPLIFDAKTFEPVSVPQFPFQQFASKEEVENRSGMPVLFPTGVFVHLFFHAKQWYATTKTKLLTPDHPLINYLRRTGVVAEQTDGIFPSTCFKKKKAYVFLVACRDVYPWTPAHREVCILMAEHDHAKGRTIIPKQRSVPTLFTYTLWAIENKVLTEFHGDVQETRVEFMETELAKIVTLLQRVYLTAGR